MRLIYERGEERIAFPIDEGETYIGRKENCEIHLPDGSLSKRHARLVRQGGALTVFDAGSRNGTLVDGELLTESKSRRVYTGSTIQCGKLVFLVEGVARDAASGGEEFEVLEESEQGPGGVPVAKAVVSAEVRPSVLDVMPELEDKPTARFVLVDGPEPRSWDLLARETVTIGSKPENRIVIDGDGVSRYHAEVVWDEGKWVLKDLGSRNGVFVGGNPVDLYELRDQDEVQIGTVKLRFELVAQSPMAPLVDLLNKYKEDPVKAFKEDPRLRMGVAAFLTAVILVVISLASPGGAAVAEGNPAWLEDATHKLAAGDYKGAREELRRASSQGYVTEDKRKIHRALTDVLPPFSDLNQRDSDWFMRFRWGKADELLAETAKTKDMPGAVVAWVTEKRQWVARHSAAYDQLGQAQGLASSAGELARQGSLTQAVQTFRQALSSYESVDRGTPFAAVGMDAATGLRKQVHELLSGELRRRLGAAIPDWDEAKELSKQAVEFAWTSDQRAELRRIEEECDINRRDEEFYRLAVDIVNNRDLPNYQTAIRYLKQVDPRSRIYPDAKAYLDWIDADLKVREAKKAYDQGEEKRAFDLLREAMAYEVLGPEARLSVQTRQQSWKQVINSYKRGMLSYKQGKNTEAKSELEKVIKLETNRENWYHKQARAQLTHIAKNEKLGLDNKLSEGIKALREGNYEACLQWFAEVRGDTNCRSSDLEKIREQVVEMKRARGMVREAKNLIIAGRDEKYLELYYKLKLLLDWLPPNDRDLGEVKKSFEHVRTRLNTLLKAAQANRQQQRGK